MKNILTAVKATAILMAGVLLFSCTKTKVVELTVSPTTVSFQAAGGDQSVSITSNDSWTVTKTADWISLSATSGEGSATLKITAAENTTLDARNAEVNIVAGELARKVTVSQSGQQKAISIGKDKVDMASEGGSIEVPVISNTSWTVSIPEEVAWISADKLSGEKDGTVTLTFEKNIYRKGRSAEVVFAAGEGLSVSLPVAQDLAPISRQTDSLALVAIYNAADGANWKAERRWDLSTSIDKWDGVTVADNRVTKFQITAASVIPSEWTMPSEIGDLTELTILKVNQNKLSGEIPEEIYSLSKLTDLWLQNDNLSGVISEKLGQLTQLKNFYIDRNTNIAGTIPATIGQLKKLENINISKTGIGGSIPAELVGCESLVNFMAYENKLSGQVPDIWDQFTKVGIIQLYGNPGLEGPLPASCGRATTTAKNYSLRFDGCNFTGNIPESYATLPSVCKQFWVKNNKLSGVVPEGVQKHANWTNWKAADNILPQQEGYGLTLE